MTVFSKSYLNALLLQICEKPTNVEDDEFVYQFDKGSEVGQYETNGVVIDFILDILGSERLQT